MLQGLLSGLYSMAANGACWLLEMWLCTPHQRAGARQCEATLVALYPVASGICLLVAGCQCFMMAHSRLSGECRCWKAFLRTAGSKDVGGKPALLRLRSALLLQGSPAPQCWQP